MSRWSPITVHIAVWVALAIAAYATAGQHSLVRCWHIIPIYLPPVGVALLAIAAYSIVVLILSLFRPRLRSTMRYWVAVHAMVLILGLVACYNAAWAAPVGSTSCL